MTFARNLFRLYYLVGFKPWDTGVPPPELVALVEGTDAPEPGRALDLGCGTGTNAIYMAQRGWEVTAIDHVRRPLEAARRKADAAGVSPWFVEGDVTRLPELGIGAGYRLLFDLGCFHGVPPARRDAYAAGVTAAASPDATLLMYAMAEGAMRVGPHGASEDELRRRFAGWELREATHGEGRIDAWWYRLERARE